MSGILFERDGAVARITLNRPEVGNAIDIPMARALMEAAIICDADDAIRCVLIGASGELFCAGGDITAFADAGDRLPAMLKEITAYLHSAIACFMRMDKPLVTAVNGAAAGAGVGIAVMGDIVLSNPAASFMLAYTGIGMSPDGATTWLLPRLIGLRRAQELCLRNIRIQADEAASIGLTSRVVAEGALDAETMTIAQELARSARSAMGTTRRLLLASFSNTLETHMEHESRGIAAQGRGEGREGIEAFLKKRPPNFVRGD